MKRFQFSLETLLEIRTQNIHRSASNLFQCTKDLNHIHEELEDIHRHQVETEAELKDKRAKGDYRYEDEYHAYMALLNEKEKTLLHEKAKMQKKLLEAQEKITLLVKERKVVAKLKEKKYALWESKIDASFK